MSIEIKLLEHGVYHLTSETLSKNYNNQSPKDFFYASLQDNEAISVSDKILLTNGLAFGIKILIGNDKGGEVAQFTIRITHPEIENPDTNFTFTETVQLKEIEFNKPHLEFYKFDYSWEMIPGFWSIQIEHQSEILFIKEFELYLEPFLEKEEEEIFFYDL